jgi:cytosine/adenosine deaminase-related metal-dependent hydrolase
MQVNPAITRLVLGLTIAALPVQALVSQRRADDSFRVVNVRLFDGARVVERTEVAVVGGTIRAIGADAGEWRELRVVDGGGATLLPGFIDAHVHARNADELRQSLRFGVTTVLDMGAVVEPKQLFALRDVAKAASDLADIRLAGFFARACACPDPRISVDVPPVLTVEDAKRFVAARHAEGTNHLKIGLSGLATAARGIPNLDESRARTLVETAHALGMLAVAHVENLDDVGSHSLSASMASHTRGAAEVRILASPDRSLSAVSL